MEIQIMRDFNVGRVVIYLWEKEEGYGMKFYSYNGEHIEVTTTKEPVTREDPIAKPLLILPLRMWDIVSKLLVAEIAKDGIQTENENLLQGKFIATEKHLEDLRIITSKLLKIELK